MYDWKNNQYVIIQIIAKLEILKMFLKPVSVIWVVGQSGIVLGQWQLPKFRLLFKNSRTLQTFSRQIVWLG